MVRLTGKYGSSINYLKKDLTHFELPQRKVREAESPVLASFETIFSVFEYQVL